MEKAVESLKAGDFSDFEIPKVKSMYRREKSLSETAKSHKEKDIIIYTDGSCFYYSSMGTGGWAFISSWSNKRLFCAGFSLCTTNNRMELTAAIKSLEEMKTKVSDCKGRILVYTDSMYVIYCINGYRRWLRRKKQDIKNPDLVEKLVNLSESLSVEWEWVRGHNGNPLNEECDAMAAEAAELQESFRNFVRI
jgi:ribonuclease HI